MVNELGINFGRDFMIGFTCKFADTIAASTNLTVDQNDLNETDVIDQNVKGKCKLVQYESEYFERATQSKDANILSVK